MASSTDRKAPLVASSASAARRSVACAPESMTVALVGAVELGPSTTVGGLAFESEDEGVAEPSVVDEALKAGREVLSSS